MIGVAVRTSQPTLLTERLTLSELTVADTRLILAIYNDPDFLANVGDRGLRTDQDAVAFIEDSPGTRYSENGFGMCRVALAGDNTPIGLCGILKRNELDDPDLGFAFLPEYRGRGYAFEASAAVVADARQSLDVEKLLAITNSGNERSIRLLERLGFRFDGMIDWSDDDERLRLFELVLRENNERRC